MKHLTRLLSFPLVCSTLVLQAQAPVITGFHPDNLIVQTERVFVYTHLDGKNFWPSGPNDPNRWHLYVRQQGGPWTTTDIRIDTGTPNDLGFHILSQPYLATPGLLEFKVTVDGVESNIFPVQVKRVPPRLDFISPTEILMTATLDPAAFNLFVRLHYWINPIQVVINGKGYGYLSRNTADEEAQTPWPEELRKPGVYTVQLRNDIGTSAAKTVEIISAPILTVATPSAIHPSDWSPKAPSVPSSGVDSRPMGTTLAAGSARPQAALSGTTAAAQAALATFELRVAFQGSAPTSLYWQTDKSSWQDVSVKGALKGSEARLSLPISTLTQAAWVELRASNRVGESKLRVPILPDPVQIHRDPLRSEISTPLQTPPPSTRGVARELPALPPPVVQRWASLSPRMQPSLRAWVEDQAQRQRSLPAPNPDAVRAAARARFGSHPPPAAPAAPPPATRVAAGKPVIAASTSTPSQLAGMNLGDADIEAVAFLVLAQATRSAQDDLKAIMDGVKSINQQKDGLRALQNDIGQVRPGAQPADAPCSSPLCGTITARAHHVAAQLPGRARFVVQPVATYGDLARLEASLKRSQDSLSELGEAESLRLQQAMDRLEKFMATLSNLEKKVNDTSGSIIANLK